MILSMPPRSLARLLLLAAAAAAATAQTPAPSSWPLVVEPMTSPAAPDSGQPQLTTSHRGVLLSWVERAGTAATLKFAERTREGWSAPVTVATGTDWFVNWADVPSVLRLADGAVAAHWLQKSGAGTYAYDVRLSVSTDEGRTWSPSFTPHHDGTQTEHGFATLVQMPGGWLGLVWLDGRAMAPATSGGHTGHGGGGAMSLRFATFDRNLKQIDDRPVDLKVCECCPTAAAVTSEGVIAAFRNRGDDELRDIHIARFVDGRWSESVPLHRDNWRIDACPVNGPMLSARGQAVAAAWLTMKNDSGHAFVAFSDDAGRTFGQAIQLDDSQSTGRVDVELLPDGSALASYLEVGEGRSQLRVRRVERSGARSAAITVAGVDAGRTSGYPRIALHGNEVVFAWIERVGTPRVRTAVAQLPRAR
jgi:hypothetical protein